MKLIIAGYTAAPATAQDAAVYYGKLLQVEQADGLQFAWAGPGTPSSLEPVLADLPKHWCITLNDIPATWRACDANKKFGLASPDDAGREQAMAMVRDVVAAIKTMNDRAGRQVVAAMEIHCAPGFDDRVLMPEASAFERSLAEVAALDWDGCKVMVEHCDAFVVGQKPAKGFLKLGEVIDALKSVQGSPITLGINWGRSMLELRDPERVIDHVVQAHASGLLDSFTFSGTAGVDNAYGSAWLDSHVPFADTLGGVYNEPASGMTMARAAQVLPYIAGCSLLFVKTQWPKSRTDPLERAASVIANFDTLVQVLRSDTRVASQLRLSA